MKMESSSSTTTTKEEGAQQQQQLKQQQQQHKSIVLFYKYFIPTITDNNNNNNNKTCRCCCCYPKNFFLKKQNQQYSEYYVQQIYYYLRDLCGPNKLSLKGRILLSTEGINGTLSGYNDNVIQEFITNMEQFNILHDIEQYPADYYDNSDDDDDDKEKNNNNDKNNDDENCVVGHIFQNIDWKLSSCGDDTSDDGTSDDSNNNGSFTTTIVEPFPDLKISIVKEIVSTGGAITIDDMIDPTNAGKHLTPEEFHTILQENSVENNSSNNNNNNENEKEKEKKDIVLIDVRNTFEYDVGHFINPTTTIIEGGSGEQQQQLQQYHQPTPAMNPNMVTFSSFDTTFCTKYANELKDKKVLMYCTGGIRCEKASIMLKKRGVTDVNQLSGGIHKYIEKYGSNGYFKGLNFVFDQRVTMKPKTIISSKSKTTTTNNNISSSTSVSESNNDQQQQDTTSSSPSSLSSLKSYEVVGKCIECNEPYDTICGSRVCSVCRDLVLVCEKCQSKLREYHCKRHSSWKHCYYTFLELFDVEELQQQCNELEHIRNTKLVPPSEYKNPRRTITRQIEKIQKHIKLLEVKQVTVNKNAPRRCRTCSEPNTICDGRCWGFWKTQRTYDILPRRHTTEEKKKSSDQSVEGSEGATIPDTKRPSTTEGSSSLVETPEPILPVKIGDIIEPGPNWNVTRLGNKTESDGRLKRGTVVEIKSWAGNELNCVAVLWNSAMVEEPTSTTTTTTSEEEEDTNLDATSFSKKKRKANETTTTTTTTVRPRRNQPVGTVQPQIYRWGVMAMNGTRMYDVQIVEE